MVLVENYGCLVMIVVILFGILLANAIRVSAGEKRLCTTCGYVGKPKSGNAGNFGVEVLLWLLFIIPGLIYSLWRMSTVKKICPKCGGKEMIPPDSLIARKLLGDPASFKPASHVPSGDQPVQFCIHCGQSNPALAAFCNSCGRPPKQ